MLVVVVEQSVGLIVPDHTGKEVIGESGRLTKELGLGVGTGQAVKSVIEQGVDVRDFSEGTGGGERGVAVRTGCRLVLHCVWRSE